MDLKKTARKTWHFIWEDNSPLSWVVNVVLAFVLIKFIVYPGLAFILATSHPVVAVVSGSMEHDAGFDTWWAERGAFYAQYDIEEEEFRNYIFADGFNRGDIMVLRGKEPQDIKKGDVIVFTSNQPEPIIHRVIEKAWNENQHFTFTTKGDNNRVILPQEVNVPESRVIGTAWIRIPYLGFVKIWFVGAIDLVRG